MSPLDPDGRACSRSAPRTPRRRRSWSYPSAASAAGASLPRAARGAGCDCPATPERITTTARGWHRASAAGSSRPAAHRRPRRHPLVLWIHGGPLELAGTRWHWRWNPHLLVERGYAVLLPDPGLSTGYGIDFMRRGWGRWGEEPYTDLMAVIDDVVARPDLDATRTAAMGGSFGGYMANWVAGHTDRFRAIVTHASLWEMRGFHGTTDWATRGSRSSATPTATRRATRTRLPASAWRPSGRRCWSSTASWTTACPSARRCGSGPTSPVTA